MNFLTQFWPQFSVIVLFFLFLIKDATGFGKDSIKTSATIEVVRYGLEFGVVIASGFLSWNFFSFVYLLVVVFSIFIATMLFIFWRHFEIIKLTDSKMKDMLTSKIRLWDFATIILLFFAGFFDELIAALWK
jgi:hypothetical protein